MVHWPVRKCYHATKVTAVIILVVTILGLFEHWRGGKRSARALSMNGSDEIFEQQILQDEARIIPGLGEGGTAVYLEGKEKILGEESVKKMALNVYLSEKISYNRTLRDFRHPACAGVTYDAELPSTSVIIIFHNEPYSVVVRTIWSVLNSARRDNAWYKDANYYDKLTGKVMTLGYPGQDPNSPYVYLKEIILVDDSSTLPELKGKLSHYIRTRMPANIIKILRLPQRRGLMLARISGARAARGEVLVFLDAHCECGTDWLRPLLQRLTHKRDSVLTPLIDVVDQDTFQLDAAENFQIGGFTFAGHFTWTDVPLREKKRRGSEIAPTWSPTMAGGLFAINRAYYWELGAYDEQMAGWGGENLELSFRIWQCGGTLETIPCSRVGHVFRGFHPYGMPMSSDTHGINTARMAEVWMDEYKELFYLHRPDLRKNPKIGDVTHRKVLREKLQCKNFQWFLDNIYPEKFVPVRDAYGYGRFRNKHSGQCLDTLQHEREGATLGVYPCHSTLQATQYLTLSVAGELRDEEYCAELAYRKPEDQDEYDVRRVIMFSCQNKMRQKKWRYVPAHKQVQHVESGYCLEAAMQSGADAVARRCDVANQLQRWDIEYSELNEFHAENPESAELEDNLNRLRGQRRISRSLMSVGDRGESGERRHSAHSKHKPKKNKKHKKHKATRSSKNSKNKFVIKLVRTLPNNTEDHLEVEIHCKHHQLYPNNTFVRDLVTILNDKDIKVINNGRVFERNKVTVLSRAPPPSHVADAASTPSSPPPRPRPRPPPRPAAAPAEPPAMALDALLPPLTMPPIIQFKPKKRKLPKKVMEPKHMGAMTDIVPPDAGGAGDPARESRGHKKIIIEDFVAVKPMDNEIYTPKRDKKRNRKHKHLQELAARGTVPDAAPDSVRDTVPDTLRNRIETPVRQQSEEKPVSSIEDAPMVSVEEPLKKRDEDRRFDVRERDGDGPRLVNADGDVERGRKQEYKIVKSVAKKRDEHMETTAGESETTDSDERWPMGVSHYRTSKERQRTSEQKEIGERSMQEKASESEPMRNFSLSEGANVRREGGNEGPLKVVMRSNLTFNIGDEFFESWRRNTDDKDVAELLEELSIPANASRGAPPSQAWLRAPPATDGGGVATGAEGGAGNVSAPTSADSSDSSDTASSET